MTETDETQIRALIDNWEKSINAKDVHGIIVCHSDDIVLFDVIEPLQSKGISAYKQSWEQQFFPWYGEEGEFKVHDLSVFADDDTAFCYGIIYCSGTENGQKISLKVRLTIGLEKIDGEWVIVHEHHSEAAK